MHSLKTIITSNLNDITMDAHFQPGRAALRAKFIKFLIHTIDDLNASIDVETEFQKFLKEVDKW